VRRPQRRRGGTDAGRTGNVLNTIRPYWDGATWVFDDPPRGLAREPFVAGTPDIIDRALDEAGLPPRQPFLVVFSDREFPGCRIVLERVREEAGGHWYRCGDMEGWLCPALLRYFGAAPVRIYCQIVSADLARAQPARMGHAGGHAD
jgi:hypothetical protein